MKSYKRAIRRLHKKRMKRKARKLYHWNPKAEKWADNLTVCSCPMCGNQRRYFHKKTLQEKKAAYGYKEEVQEISVEIEELE